MKLCTRATGHRRLAPHSLVLLATLTVAGCASPPDAPDAGATEVSTPDLEPELTLNLPSEQAVDCPPADKGPASLLQRGIEALVAGEHVEAVSFFQRYARLESTAEARWESGIAIAYDSILPQSPFYDLQAAGQSYLELQSLSIDSSRVDPQVMVMHDALATLTTLQSQVGELRADKAQLEENLAKREEALKRLRELTLGQ